jgi:hypothetical protein
VLPFGNEIVRLPGIELVLPFYVENKYPFISLHPASEYWVINPSVAVLVVELKQPPLYKPGDTSEIAL